MINLLVILNLNNQVVQTEAVRHIKEEHAKETFQCKLCLAADPACFPYAETVKEMTGHMVLKHKDVSGLKKVGFNSFKFDLPGGELL